MIKVVQLYISMLYLSDVSFNRNDIGNKKFTCYALVIAVLNYLLGSFVRKVVYIPVSGINRVYEINC